MVHNEDRVRVSLAAGSAPQPSGPVPLDAEPFRIVVLGDFSGVGSRDRPLAERHPVLVRHPQDLVERLRPTVELQIEGPGAVRLDLRDIEDLHPDQLVERVPHLRALAASIDAEVEGLAATPSPEPAPPSSSNPPPEGLLDEIVEETPRVDVPAGADMTDTSDLHAWIRAVAEPHRRPAETAGQEALRRRLEREAARRVLDVLHAPEVRRLEALWRSLVFLLSKASSPEVRVYVLDISRTDLVEALAGPDIEGSALANILREPRSGPWVGRPGLLVGAFAFGPGTRDVALLNRLAILAHGLRTPLVCDAAPALLGLESFTDPIALPDPPEPDTPAWDAFRETPAARSVGLAAPRFLLRMPYGEATDPCRSLPVEEMESRDSAAPVDSPWHPLLWGYPSFVCAAAIGIAFREQGPGFRPVPRDFTGRPVLGAGESRDPVRATEVVWSEDALAWVAEHGVVPIAGFRGEARMRFLGPLSAARPRAPLAGWWSGG